MWIGLYLSFILIPKLMTHPPPKTPMSSHRGLLPFLSWSWLGSTSTGIVQSRPLSKFCSYLPLNWWLHALYLHLTCDCSCNNHFRLHLLLAEIFLLPLGPSKCADDVSPNVTTVNCKFHCCLLSFTRSNIFLISALTAIRCLLERIMMSCNFLCSFSPSISTSWSEMPLSVLQLASQTIRYFLSIQWCVLYAELWWIIVLPQVLMHS